MTEQTATPKQTETVHATETVRLSSTVGGVVLSSLDILDAMMKGMVVPHKRDEELLRYYAVKLDEALRREGRRCPVNAASCNLRRLFERYPYMGSEKKPRNGGVMVEALKFAISRAEEARDYVLRSSGTKGCMEEIINECREAIKEPPRNCDVGTALEQAERFKRFCDGHTDSGRNPNCGMCPILIHHETKDACQFYWGQMPCEAPEDPEKRGAE